MLEKEKKLKRLRTELASLKEDDPRLSKILKEIQDLDEQPDVQSTPEYDETESVVLVNGHGDSDDDFSSVLSEEFGQSGERDPESRIEGDGWVDIDLKYDDEQVFGNGTRFDPANQQNPMGSNTSNRRVSDSISEMSEDDHGGASVQASENNDINSGDTPPPPTPGAGGLKSVGQGIGSKDSAFNLKSSVSNPTNPFAATKGTSPAGQPTTFSPFSGRQDEGSSSYGSDTPPPLPPYTTVGEYFKNFNNSNLKNEEIVVINYDNDEQNKSSVVVEKAKISFNDDKSDYGKLVYERIIIGLNGTDLVKNDRTLACVTMLIAIKNEGVGSNKETENKFKEDLRKILPILGKQEKDLDGMVKEAVKFSKQFQDNMKDAGVLTGNPNATPTKQGDIVGMRLKRIHPDMARELVDQNFYDQVMGTLHTIVQTGIPSRSPSTIRKKSPSVINLSSQGSISSRVGQGIG